MIKKIYSQWAFVKRSIIQSKKIDHPLLIVDNLTAKLIDKLQANI